MNLERRPRIVALAYACEPGKGSEPAAGWMWSRLLGELGETWVITRANNQAAIEAEITRMDSPPNVHFVYVDIPSRFRRWKRRQRGVRLYYVLWQYAALREARRLGRRDPFDLAWHLTFANAWIGSTASMLGIPFVYGPVGAGVGTQWRLASTLGGKGLLSEVARDIARMMGRYFNPLARNSWHRASLILVQNEETRDWMPRRHQTKTAVFPHVVIERVLLGSPVHDKKVMLYAGRLSPLKGVSLAIRALDLLPDWRLVICGDGPDLARLRELAQRLGVSRRIDFRGWVDRDELFRTMREDASVFVFPSFHDQAPWVVAEAMASGLPVVCLRLGGAPVITGGHGAIAPSTPTVTTERIARGVLQAAGTERELVYKSVVRFLPESRVASLQRVLNAHQLLSPHKSSRLGETRSSA